VLRIVRAQDASSAAVAGLHVKIRRRVGVSGAFGVERSEDRDVLHAARDAELRVDAEVGIDLVDAGAAIAIQQRHADRVRSGRHRDAELAGVRHGNLLAVDRHVSCACGTAATRPAATDGELVLRVEREGVRERQPAAGAERQTVDVLVLRKAGRRRIDDLRGGGRTVANGGPADFHRGRHIALHQGRRHGERFGKIVEPFARAVGGQERRDVDVEEQEVPNRVGVFGAIQAMERRRREVRVRRQRLVESGFQRRREAVQNCAVGTRRAGRRHQAGFQLEHHLFERLGAAGNIVEADRIERQPAGLQAIVVTGDAVRLEQRGIGRLLRRLSGRLGRRGRLLLRRRGRLQPARLVGLKAAPAIRPTLTADRRDDRDPDARRGKNPDDDFHVLATWPFNYWQPGCCSSRAA